MSYYSILAFSTVSVQYREPLVFIEPGINAFSVLTDDVEALLERLRKDGIRVDVVNNLDGGNQDTRGEGERSTPSLPESGT